MKHSQETLKPSLANDMTKIKTILAPNAPWPKPEPAPIPKPKPKPKKKKKTTKKAAPKIKLGNNLDYFADAREQLQAIKDSKKSGASKVTKGRLKGAEKLSG